ncbi:MAG: CAP domain-containing protein [Chthoniobacterales bacterium]|nr:CAP domain-containing protein [Chthoniobacterales bacterium]
MRRFLVLACLALILSSRPTGAEPRRYAIVAADVVREMNLARQHPEVYAGYLETLRGSFHGKILVLPGRTMMRTKEGVGAVNDAIRFLRGARPLAPLACSPGISMAAADHVADQASDGFGHGGSDRTNPAQRMNRHGTWSGGWAENISYGKATAREIVIALLIDDGLRGRKHRKNIFNPAFNFAGAAAGSHARYGTVCSIDFAAGYVETASASRALIARN